MLLCIVNSSSVWSYQDTCEGQTPSIFAQNTSIESGLFNDTGIHDNGDGTWRLYLQIDNPPANYYISEDRARFVGQEDAPVPPAPVVAGSVNQRLVFLLLFVVLAGALLLVKSKSETDSDIIDGGIFMIFIIVLIGAVATTIAAL